MTGAVAARLPWRRGRARFCVRAPLARPPARPYKASELYKPLELCRNIVITVISRFVIERTTAQCRGGLAYDLTNKEPNSRARAVRFEYKGIPERY